MSKLTGDKARYEKEHKKKMHRRELSRASRASMETKVAEPEVPVKAVTEAEASPAAKAEAEALPKPRRAVSSE